MEEETAGTPEETRVKRRLVQAMLFPHNAKIGAKDECKEGSSQNDDVKGGCREGGEEFGELGLSQSGKKKRGRPKSANSKPRASKKKVQMSTEGALDLNGNDAGSTDVTKLDTPLKTPEKQHQKRQRDKQACIILDGQDDNCASPSIPTADIKVSPKLKRRANSTPRKQQSNVTPKKKLMGSVMKRVCFGKTSPDLPDDESVMKSLPNLRLEAKFIAEENSRMYAGKQVHPFFMSRKVDKRNQDMGDVGTEQPSLVKEGKEIGIYPIHVYEKFEDIAATLDWKQWTFSDVTVATSSCTPEIEQSPIFGGYSKPLQFDNYLGVPLSNRKFLCQNQTAENPTVSLDQVARGSNTSDFFLDNSNSMIHDALQQSIPSQDRFGLDSLPAANIRRASLHCLHHSENCLWTDKYMPENPMQVCGNGEAVKRLSEWLHLWHTTCSRTSKIDEQNGNSISHQSECYSEDMDEDPSLENVLLITGPVGSGKSAAIYACAKEQGFEVIEVNASDWRSGSLVKQRFGEAVESHWVRGANTASSEVNCQTRSFPCVTLEKHDSDIVELLTLSNGEDFDHISEGVMRPYWEDEIRTTNCQKELTTLILFEDVDATLCEDYGFISSIHLLSKTAKRPMILTSNSENPLLPSNLDRLHLRFTVPSMEELTGLASMVCAAEEAIIHSCLVEHFAFLFKRDIRKTILNLQFWFQGQDIRKGDESQGIKNQRLLDLDASHWVLPKLIPWSCPSRLSKFVDEEITKSLMIMTESNNIRDVVDRVNQNEYRPNDIPVTDGGPEPEHIKAKKEEMLSLHWSFEDDIELVAPSGAICDFNGFPQSPAADAQTLGKRNIHSVIFSDSEDEYLTERKPLAFRRMLENSDDEAFEAQGTAPSTSLHGERCRSNKCFNPFEGEKVEEGTCQCAGMEDCSHIHGASHPVDLSYSHIETTSKSFGVSYVPESLILPETLSDYDNQTGLFSKTINSDQNLYDVPIDFLGTEISNSLVSVEGEECVDCSHMNGASQPVDLSYSHIEATCKSFDVSYAPESLIVPETLFDYNNQTELSSKTVNSRVNVCNKVPIDFQGTEIFNSLVSVEGEECVKYSSSSYENQYTCASSCHINLRSVNTDVVGNSQFSQEEYHPRGYQVIDECSRVDFVRKCESSHIVLSAHGQIDLVQETWRKLRNSKVDVGKHITTQERDVAEALQITTRLSNVVSDAELLLKDCQPHILDLVDPLMTPHEGLQSYNWHDHQLEMASSFAEHGICLFAKESAVMEPKMGSSNSVDLSWEMLASSKNTMALGNLITRQSEITDSTKINLPGSCFQSKSETKSRLSTVLQCVVPKRSYLSVQGHACYEYLSSLSQISRLEANRLSDHVRKGTQRRTRVPRHYLTSGAFTLTPDDISFLGKWNNCAPLSSQSHDASDI